ncbi:MAG TPA: RpiB/LacA/LacB family sugar-phosphate isomerase [Acidimicrobiales bacterium]|jgi:RpiB/LacA/LacB family sugar-phosphate isomerase
MRIAVGSDHAGFDMKVQLAGFLRAAGHDVTDVGTQSGDVTVDYPEFGVAVGRRVAAGLDDLGVCACGSGIGISIAANKVPGVRAAAVHDVTTAALARRHNHANVICFGGRTTGTTTALDALTAFLAAEPEHGRHDRRVAMLDHLGTLATSGEGG